MADDVEVEGVDPAATPEQPGPPRAQWEYRTEFRIVKEMKVIIHKSIEASESELELLRRKLDKITYGS